MAGPDRIQLSGHIGRVYRSSVLAGRQRPRDRIGRRSNVSLTRTIMSSYRKHGQTPNRCPAAAAVYDIILL